MGVIVAVNVTVWVATLVCAEEITVAVAGPGETICENTGDDVNGKLESPLYVAVTV